MLVGGPARTHLPAEPARIAALYVATNQSMVQPQGRSAQSAQAVKDKVGNSSDTVAAAHDDTQDDGLQADERSLKTDLAEERKRKIEKDVALNEAARILADEVNLIHADTKLASRVLPHKSDRSHVVL